MKPPTTSTLNGKLLGSTSYVFVAAALTPLFSFSVEALSEALRDWGDKTGALVVVSHDRSFCERITFTHVATVHDEQLVIEQRDARQGDWIIGDLSEQPTTETASSSENNGKSSSKEVDPKLRKQAYNAPKRITKLESLIEKAEEKIAALDEEMLSHGSDVGKLVDLTKEKEALEAQVVEYMEEWEELEELLSQVA